jgi:hypothetical protein
VSSEAVTIMAVRMASIEVQVERHGHPVPGGRFTVDARPDDRARLAAHLEGWLSGGSWDRALWGQFTIVAMDGLRRVVVRADGR